MLRLQDARDTPGTFHAVRTRILLLAVSTALLAACGGSEATTDSTPNASTTTTASATQTSSPQTTASSKPSTSTTAPSLTGTERELELASINGVTLAAVKLNTALLAKAGWTAVAPTTTLAGATTGSAPSVAGSSAREASVLLSVLGSSSAPKGYSMKTYGSEGIVEVWDGSKLLAKTLTGLVEYIELQSDDASVCLRPSINGKADSAQQPTANDAYRNLPIGELVQPSGAEGWVIMLRLAGSDACRTALDTLRAP